MDDEPKEDLQSTESVPEAPVQKKRKYVAPTLTVYGNLQQLTGTIGLTNNADGGSGMKYKYTAP
jgi:hypothetical protein